MCNKLLLPILLSSAIAFFVQAAPAAPATQVAANVSQLGRDLSSPLVPVRRSAAEKLGQLGAPASSAVPALVETLRDDDDMVRRNSAWALGKIKEPAAPIVAALVAKLKAGDDDWGVRHNTALALGWIGQPAVAPLRELLDAPAAWTRAYATDALLRIAADRAAAGGEIIASVSRLLADDDVFVRSFAATLAGRIGAEAAETVPGLVALLDVPDAPPRINAIQALNQIGKPAVAAVPRIRRALREDQDQWVRIGASQALLAMGSTDMDTIAALIGAFADQKDRVGTYAVQAVARLGEPAVPALRKALKSKQRRTRIGAAEALAFMGERAGAEAAAAGDALLAVLARDEDWEVRSLAAAALGFLGRSGDTTVAALRHALRDEHEIVRLNARDALQRLGREAPANDAAPSRGKSARAGQPRQV